MPSRGRNCEVRKMWKSLPERASEQSSFVVICYTAIDNGRKEMKEKGLDPEAMVIA